MLYKLKTKFYSLLKELGYNITDSAEYKETFPWLMLRTDGYTVFRSFSTNISNITLTLDIFSTYCGEKEIIEIAGDIESHLNELCRDNPEILYCYQKTMKILDDKTTGPVRKHGIITYEFLMGYGIGFDKEVPDNGTEN